MHVVIAEIRAKEGLGDELAELFRDFVEWVVENEAETLAYSCNRSKENRDRFVFFERYTGDKAFQAHAQSDRFAELAVAIDGKVDGQVELETFEEIAAKL